MPAGRVQAWIQKVANKYYKQVDPDYLDKVTISKEAKDYIQMMLELHQPGQLEHQVHRGHGGGSRRSIGRREPDRVREGWC